MCSVLEVWFPAHSQLVISSSGRAVFILHWDVGASIISGFCAFVTFQQLWQHLLCHLSLTFRRQRSGENTRLCIAPVILTSDGLLPVAVCLAYSPDHSTAAPMKTHLNILCLRVGGRKIDTKSWLTEAPPERELNRRMKTDRKREKDVIFFHICCFLDALLFVDCSQLFIKGWRPWTKDWFLQISILVKWKSMCEKSESHKNNTQILLGNRQY